MHLGEFMHFSRKLVAVTLFFLNYEIIENNDLPEYDAYCFICAFFLQGVPRKVT